MKKILVLIAILTAAAAHAADPDTARWREVDSARCLATSNNDVGCYPPGGMTTLVEVTRTEGGSLAFSTVEWHKACGTVGGVVHKETFTSSASPFRFFVLASGPGITCREVYITNCKVDGVAKACKDVVTAKYVRYVGSEQ